MKTFRIHDERVNWSKNFAPREKEASLCSSAASVFFGIEFRFVLQENWKSCLFSQHEARLRASSHEMKRRAAQTRILFSQNRAAKMYFRHEKSILMWFQSNNLNIKSGGIRVWCLIGIIKPPTDMHYVITRAMLPHCWHRAKQHFSAEIINSLNDVKMSIAKLSRKLASPDWACDGNPGKCFLMKKVCCARKTTWARGKLFAVRLFC